VAGIDLGRWKLERPTGPLLRSRGGLGWQGRFAGSCGRHLRRVGYSRNTTSGRGRSLVLTLDPATGRLEAASAAWIRVEGRRMQLGFVTYRSGSHAAGRDIAAGSAERGAGRGKLNAESSMHWRMHHCGISTGHAERTGLDLNNNEKHQHRPLSSF
jgi:hypothetical protein